MKPVHWIAACVVLDLWTDAFSWRSSTQHLSFPRRFSRIEERNRWENDAPLIVVPHGRISTRRTPSQSQKMVMMILSADRVTSWPGWCLFVWFLPCLCSLLAERLVVVYPCLVPCHNTTKIFSSILVAIFHKFFTTVDSIDTLKWCEKLRHPSRANLLHP